MKKDVSFVWDVACHNAFENIKKYSANPPILGAPMEKTCITQENEENKERALYYLSRTLTGPELN